MIDEPAQCQVCGKPFEQDDKGKLKIAYAYCGKAKHYIGMCGPCLTARKANLGFYRQGKYVGPLAGCAVNTK